MQPGGQAGEVEGVVVADVAADGPAAAAGVMPGDVVTRFAGQQIDSTRMLSRLVGTRDAGDEVAIEVLRNGEAREFDVELGELDEARLQAAAAPPLMPQSQRPLRPQQGQPYYKR
jgi:serine protease Do